jgi:hypothetical protein
MSIGVGESDCEVASDFLRFLDLLSAGNMVAAAARQV